LNELRLSLDNCYGIRELRATLDFSSEQVVAIYAPNGAMKSSLAQSFEDLADGVPSRDRMFPDRNTVRSITDENGVEVSGENVVVVQPYDEQFGPNEGTSTLLIDPNLRLEYDGLQEGIDLAKGNLIAALKQQAGSRKDIEKEVSLAFTSGDDNFFTALIRIQEELQSQTDAPFADIPYDRLFDDKVVAFLSSEKFRDALAQYVTRLNELLDASTYFGRKTFNYYNAANITKSLSDNGFFAAHHTVKLSGGESLEISSEAELQKLIDDEKAAISEDATLRATLAEVEKQLNRNVELRAFQEYLSDHEELLPELQNVDHFRESVWKSYLRTHYELYESVVREFRNAETRKREIEVLAAGQATLWERVVDMFNDRFFVPFRLTVKNREKVVLGQDPLLVLGFIFEDGGESAEVDRGSLLETLSTGEKKALYILNVLFEVETRRKSGDQTIFVIDDIADSFDYKNKYAIIQYLKDIADDTHFLQIVLTHNFDFFRTLNSRFVHYSQCLMALKSDASVSLVKATGIRNPFINDWKAHFFDDKRKRIASVPFIRNILEYTKGESDPDYGRLTSLLHWKADTSTVRQSVLDDIYNATFGGALACGEPDKPVVDVIREVAEQCLTAPANINFENKIVLSIAIRLEAERYMVSQIADDALVAAISSNQTPALLKMLRERGTPSDSDIAILESVVLMTPENIHLNSFMYEPILDMSDQHLRKLYRDVSGLNSAVPT
jgi:hypothetical protein